MDTGEHCVAVDSIKRDVLNYKASRMSIIVIVVFEEIYIFIFIG